MTRFLHQARIATWGLGILTAWMVVMWATMGLAVALSRSVPPDPGGSSDPASLLLGYPAPATLTALVSRSPGLQVSVVAGSGR